MPTRKLGRTSSQTRDARGLVTLRLKRTGRDHADKSRSSFGSRKMITLGKDTWPPRSTFIYNQDVVSKLFNEIAPGYADRNGGYTVFSKSAPVAGTRRNGYRPARGLADKIFGSEDSQELLILSGVCTPPDVTTVEAHVPALRVSIFASSLTVLQSDSISFWYCIFQSLPE